MTFMDDEERTFTTKRWWVVADGDLLVVVGTALISCCPWQEISMMRAGIPERA